MNQKQLNPLKALANPDFPNSLYHTKLGVYNEACGLRNVKDYLPDPSMYTFRFHSFYAWHRQGEYSHLLDQNDREMLKSVNLFNPYDLRYENE